MNIMSLRKIIFIVAIVLWTSQTRACDSFYGDIVAHSPNQQYEVRAESPDNKLAGHKTFQENFVYTFTDTKAKKPLWTRKQPPSEGSPVAIYVSDSGWTAIRTSNVFLFSIDIQGNEHSQFNILEAGLTKEENEKYVHQTTAGPRWAGYSLWYFLDIENKNLFVIRPWWGRRIIIDLDQGKAVEETKTISKAISSYERQFVLAELAKGAAERKKNKLKKSEEIDHRLKADVLTASYLAGTLKIAETIPALRQLEDYDYSGSSSGGGLSSLEKFRDEVDPHSYSTYTLRQVIQLSLRRLGETPKLLPVHVFEVRFGDYKKDHPYAPPVLKTPRQDNIEKIEKGMKAEQVLALVGSPDYVGYDTWEYDMDAKQPFSLIIKWDERHVIGVEKKTPPLWQKDFVREEEIVR